MTKGHRIELRLLSFRFDFFIQEIPESFSTLDFPSKQLQGFIKIILGYHKFIDFSSLIADNSDNTLVYRWEQEVVSLLCNFDEKNL